MDLDESQSSESSTFAVSIDYSQSEMSGLSSDSLSTDESEASDVDVEGNTSDSSYEPPPRRRRRIIVSEESSPEVTAPDPVPIPFLVPEVQDVEEVVDVETIDERASEDEGGEEEVEVDVETVAEVVVREDPKPSGSSSTSNKPKEDSDEDEDQSCPICLEPWANAGPHRLCCLRCGHLFGRSCLERWLTGCPRGQLRCPQCNRSAKKSDVRTLFAKNVRALDMTDRLRLEEEMKTEQEARRRAELQVTQMSLQMAMQQRQIETLQTRLKEATSTANVQLMTQTASKSSESLEKLYKFSARKEVSNNGGCRVLAYSSEMGLLVVSQKNDQTPWSSPFGIRKFDALAFNPSHYVPLHKKAIRDLSFHPSKPGLLLSVSLDCTARLTNVRSHGAVASFPSNVGALWSCCWDCGNTNIFYAGTQRGDVGQFDMRNLDGPIKWFPPTGDISPVISLVSVPPSAGSSMPRGGVIAGHLAGVWAHEWEGDREVSSTKLPLKGPFTSVTIEPTSRVLLASSRPSSQNLHKTHSICELEYDNNQKCRVVQTFEGGHAQKNLSRSCLAPQSPNGDLLVAAYEETASCIKLWSITESKLKLGLPISEDILDVVPLAVNGKNTLAALSEKNLYVFSQS